MLVLFCRVVRHVALVGSGRLLLLWLSGGGAAAARVAAAAVARRIVPARACVAVCVRACAQVWVLKYGCVAQVTVASPCGVQGGLDGYAMHVLLCACVRVR